MKETKWRRHWDNKTGDGGQIIKYLLVFAAFDILKKVAQPLQRGVTLPYKSLFIANLTFFVLNPINVKIEINSISWKVWYKLHLELPAEFKNRCAQFFVIVICSLIVWPGDTRL